MTYKHRLTLPFVAIVFSMGMFTLPTFAGTAQKWVGTAEFGTLELVVIADQAGIQELDYKFSEWKCGKFMSSAGGSIGAKIPFPVNDGAFSITFPISPDQKQELTVSGAFESATHAAGTWEAKTFGEVCTGSWKASAVTE